MFVFESSYHPR